MFRQPDRLYSLTKARHTMRASYKWYKMRSKALPADQLEFMETHLKLLDDALLQKNRETANKEARLLEAFCKSHFKKTPGDYLIEILIAIVIALAVATVVRQSWFELYEIPSGSMRPTFKEQDHLTVSKTTFGINVPLQTAHFMFDPKLVQRASVFIWSGDGIPHLDSDSTFMKIFPYTKRYIKRCMGKPGDSLYFYGGKVYGIDQDGNEIKDFLEGTWLKKLEHIPFLKFEGRRSSVQNSHTKIISEAVFNYFDLAKGRYVFNVNNISGEIFNGKEWIKDQPTAQLKKHDTIQTLSDFWGMRNYAIARVLNKKQVQLLTNFSLKNMEEAQLYLELRHTPSLSYPLPSIYSNNLVFIKGYATLIPLKENHIKALMNNMYTCRFSVEDGKASQYSSEGRQRNSNPLFASIPNGTYEFYYGKAYDVGFGAITHLLTEDHPIYSLKPSHVQKLFNIGIEMSAFYEPNTRVPDLFPNRYAYFRDEDLYVMGGVLMEKDDPVLKGFLESELKKEKAATEKEPYVAYKDYGPPVTKDGQLDREFIKTFGYQVPEKHYLALGDNHAMSSDSREFGPIPEANLQGTPSLIIWPPGDRLGFPNQKPYPIITTPRLIVWSIVAVILAIWYAFHRYRMTKPIFKKIKNENGNGNGT